MSYIGRGRPRPLLIDFNVKEHYLVLITPIIELQTVSEDMDDAFQITVGIRDGKPVVFSVRVVEVRHPVSQVVALKLSARSVAERMVPHLAEASVHLLANEATIINAIIDARNKLLKEITGAN